MSDYIRSIYWEEPKVCFIDQTRLPIEETIIKTSDYREVIHAIKTLQVRGAPLIGIAAAYGIYLGAVELLKKSVDFDRALETVLIEVESSRPTAKNLFVAVNIMRDLLADKKNESPDQKCKSILARAKQYHEEDKELCEKIGRFGSTLIPENAKIITHCNTGILVTGGIGTALGVVFSAANQGKKPEVFADETRPLLQGARLTAWECIKRDIPVTVLCDGASASLLREGNIDCAIVGADRIARNGDVANKIGTYSLAVHCARNSVPFYVAAPFTTFDLVLESGERIPIEQRDGYEISHPGGVMMVAEGAQFYNPAFDVTPASLITAIITDAGIYKEPFGKWEGLRLI